jgi:peptidylprolyl isomerase
MGFYAKTERPIPLNSVRIAADVPAAERSNFEVIRTDTATFAALIESRRNRPEEFFKVPAGHIELCNVPIAERAASAAAAHSP